MSKIKVQRLTEEEIAQKDIESWSVWKKEISTFPWSYSQQEECYIIEGEAIITDTDTGDSVTITTGDFVVFELGLKCEWNITQDIKKYYKFI